MARWHQQPKRPRRPRRHQQPERPRRPRRRPQQAKRPRRPRRRRQRQSGLPQWPGRPRRRLERQRRQRFRQECLRRTRRQWCWMGTMQTRRRLLPGRKMGSFRPVSPRLPAEMAWGQRRAHQAPRGRHRRAGGAAGPAAVAGAGESPSSEGQPGGARGPGPHPATLGSRATAAAMPRRQRGGTRSSSRPLSRRARGCNRPSTRRPFFRRGRKCSRPSSRWCRSPWLQGMAVLGRLCAGRRPEAARREGCTCRRLSRQRPARRRRPKAPRRPQE